MNRKTIYKGKIFEVASEKMMIGGQLCDRDLVIHSGGASVCAVLDGRILLVKQTRAGAGEQTLEIPAGMIEPGEDPKASALRELNEEAGLGAKDLKLITAFWPTPGYDTEVIYVYSAIDPFGLDHKLPLDEQEDITTLWMPLDETYQAIETGKIRDGKTILAVYWNLLQERK